jgi:putative colanic acid biosynthesis acetyltransferase WcaF
MHDGAQAMRKQVHYNAADQVSANTSVDPYLRPAFSRSLRLRRLAWGICWALLYRLSPRPLHGWRSFLLRCFGATIGPHCHFYPASKIWAPWNLQCADQVTAADGAEIYNPAPVSFGSHAILSQNAFLCGATHDYDRPEFPLIAFAMHIGAYAWICARASVAPGVNIGEGAVLGLGSVATRDLEPWTVYAGVPAVKVKDRVRPPSQS